MAKNKTMEKMMGFLKSYYDYAILFLLISWSGYINYLRHVNPTEWFNLLCVYQNIGSFVYGISSYIYKTFGVLVPPIFALLIAYFLYFGGYFTLKWIYNEPFKNKRLKTIVHVVFYLFLTGLLFAILKGGWCLFGW